jgi:hypothetical protein
MTNTTQATQTTKEVMSRAAAAVYIGIAKSTLDKLDIPRTQVRRRVFFKKENIDKWLSQNTKGAKAKGAPA